MATQNVNIGINVSDNGTAKKVVKNFQEIESAAVKARRSAQGITATINGVPSGTAGSRAVAATTAPKGQMNSQEYGSARGTAGLTGASARDFAQQAQGLGGVVRLYATYAANVFAVGAAFRALSGAMDTANLVKGLDQMGAASGTALGTLSRRLVDVTDGAISMREAMEATAKAVSSGMSSENLLRMGKVAKQAAQALGVDMADAVSRLTRGITKLEPELLDELGIFTRVDMATQAYAKSVGKSTTAITDFERRMAFANAVLEEGERKFSAIDFETNPYTKLLATLKDVAQVGLEVANNVISPIVKFLSENPKALAVALGTLGVVLLKQALPAIGQFKAGLASAAAQATELSKSRSADAVKAQKQLASILQAEQATFLDSQDQLLDTAAETLKKVGLGAGTKASKLINTNMVGIDPEGVKEVENQIKNVRIEAGKYARLVQENIKAGENPKVIQALQDKADAYYDTAYAAETVLAGEVAAVEKNSRGVEENTMAKLNNNLAEKARVSSIKQSIVANAAYNGSLVGISGAMKLANVELKNSGLQLGFFRKNLLLARAGVAAFGGMVSRVMSSIGGFLNVIAMVGAGVAFLSSFLSANAKEMSAFSGAADATDESLLNLGRTIDNINSKPFGQQFNTQSLMASATAINEITSSIGSLISKTLEADKAASGFDKFINSFKSIWGGDLRTQFAKSISGTVFGTLEKLADSPEAKKARDSIASILEVSPNASRKDWQSAFKAIADNEPKLKLVEQAMKDLGIATAVTAGKAEGFDNALKASEDAYKNFTNQFKAKDPLAQLAESLIASGIRTAEAIEVPETAIARLASIVGDVNKIALFDEQDQQNLLKYGDSITKTNQEFEKNKQAVKASKEELIKLEKQLEKFRTTSEITGLDATDEEMSGNKAFDAAKKQLDERKQQLNKEQTLVASTLVEITTLTSRFPNLAANQLIKGADMLSASISASLSKGSSAFGEAVLASVGDLPGIAKERERIEMLKLDSEARMIKIQTELARATMLNSVELRRTSAVQAVETAQASVAGAGAQRNFDAENRLKEAQKTLTEIDKSIAVIKVDPSQALAALKTIQSEIKSGNTTIQQDAASLFEYINSLAGLALQEQNNSIAKRVVAYKAIIEGVKEEFKESAKVLTNQREENALLLANYTIQKARNGSLTEAESLSAQEAQTQAITLERSQKLLVINEKLAVLAQAQSTGETALSDEVFQKQKQLLLDQGINIVREASNKITTSELATSREIYAEQQRLVALENELVAIKKSGTDATQQASDKIRDIANQTAKDIGTYTPEYQAQQDVLLQIAKTRGEAERAEQELTSAFIIRSYALQAEAKVKIDAGAAPDSVNETLGKLTAEAEAYGNKVLAINSARDAEINAISQIEAARQNQTSFDSTIESIKALDSVWTSFGSTLADTVSIFVKLGKSQEQYARTLANLEFERDATTDTKKQLDFQKQIDKTRKASVKDEVSGYAKTAGAAKTLFKEKTFAYKALAATEKILHVTRLAMDIKEIISDTTKTGTSVANSVMRTGASVVEAGVDGVKAVVKAIANLPFPLNIAAGAATAAVVAGLLSQIGGKSPSVGSAGFTPNAEQRQETQGTGMAWDSAGNKVETGGGVFGDPTQKLDSINKGIQTLKDNSIEGLFYDNRMLKALESIAQSITGAAQSLYSTPGIRSGLNFGSLPGTTINTNWYQDIPLIGGALGSIFGGETSASASIEDAGIQLRGTLDSIANGMMSGVMQYKDILTQFKEDGGWFGSNKYWSTLSRETEAVNKDIRNSFADVFKDAKNMFTQVADVAGISSQQVTQAFQNITTNLDISLKGLTGEEVLKELNATISGELDKVAKQLFSSFDKFKKFGEGYTDTVIRVVDGNNKVDTALRAMGIRFSKITNNFEVSETIINKMAGSLERFTDQAKFFIDNFLTEAERMANMRQGVNKALGELNLSTSLTRDEFKRLVQMQNLSTQTGRDMYQGLVDIQEGFFKVTQRLEDLKTESTNLEIELLKAQERTQEADAALKKLATEGLTGAELAVYNYNESLKKQIEVVKERTQLDKKLFELTATREQLRERELKNLNASNRQLQRDIWLREDQISAAKALQTNLQGVTSTIKSQITSLQDYKNALLGSANSTLTATQQYSNARSEVESLVSTIAKTATTPEEIDARNQALSKFSSASDKFLGKSRELFASGAQYSADFNTVMSIINTVSSGLETQLTDSEKQLSALETANTFLESISTTSKNTAQLLETYLSLSGTPLNTSDTSGSSSIIERVKSKFKRMFSFDVGTNYVPEDMIAQVHRGERIVPAADNAQLIQNIGNRNRTNELLVVEIKKLNQKIESLERTVAEGAVINAQATERNTQQVSQAVVDSSGKVIQAGRLQAKASIK